MTIVYALKMQGAVQMVSFQQFFHHLPVSQLQEKIKLVCVLIVHVHVQFYTLLDCQSNTYCSGGGALYMCFWFYLEIRMH